MRVATCTIGRMENSYVKEFVDHYRDLWVDKMFIYDNNYNGEDYFEEVLSDDISKGFVEIIDYRNRECCQLNAYQDCYNKHNGEFDWVIFCDIDEFLFFRDFDNVKEFLFQDKFNGFDMIHLNWKVYDDNVRVFKEEGCVKDRFTRVKLPLDFKKQYNFPENSHIKSIVRGSRIAEWNQTPHTPTGLRNCCDANGMACDPNSPFNAFNYDSAWFNHYQTK